MADLSAVIDAFRTSIEEGIRTAVVAKAQDYDSATQTLTATPLVKESRTIGDAVVTIDTIAIPGVPVAWPQGGGRALTWGIDDGDLVLLLYRTNSHDEIDAGTVDSTPTLPQALRVLNPADVIAIPGYAAPGSSPSAGRVDGQPTLSMNNLDSFHVGATGASILLVREDVLSSWLSTFITWASTHAHTGVTTGPGVSGAPNPPPSAPSGLGSGRIKVDS